MAGTLELSDWEFRTMINVLSVLTDKADNMQGQMGKASRDGNPNTKKNC